MRVLQSPEEAEADVAGNPQANSATGDGGMPNGAVAESVRRAQDIIERCAEGLALLRARAPRVQCLTNTVAQPITANLLLAAGARVSMATHPDEVAEMTRTADGVLINLGTLDTAREAAIGRLIDGAATLPRAIVLDPVFVELSPLRMALARRVIAHGEVIVKGNSREMVALRAAVADLARAASAAVTTGTIDTIESRGGVWRCGNGHAWMGDVSGVGCAAGALIAAMRTVIDDPGLAAVAGVTSLAIAGEIAAERSTGSGSFSVQLIDALGALDAATFIARARINDGTSS